MIWMRGSYGFVTMVKEKYWVEYCRRVAEGERFHSHVLSGAAPPKSARFLLFYVSSPVKALGGYASFVERKVGDPLELRNAHGGESVLKSKKEYEEFTGSVGKVSFVRFTDLRAAAHPIALSSLLMLLGVKRLSRKGFYLGRDTVERLISVMG